MYRINLYHAFWVYLIFYVRTLQEDMVWKVEKLWLYDSSDFALHYITTKFLSKHYIKMGLHFVRKFIWHMRDEWLLLFQFYRKKASLQSVDPKTQKIVKFSLWSII